jgi:uncharacterized membrane protein (DUF4010 family)
LVSMLVSLLGHIVSRRIGPSQPVISIILGFGSSLIPVAIALFVVRKFENAVHAGRIEVDEVVRIE